jgi:hypothetical protein
MRVLSAVACASIAAAFLASCSSNEAGPGGAAMPSAARGGVPTSAVGFVAMAPTKGLHGKHAPVQARRGIYVSQLLATDVLGYRKNNSSNGWAICTIGGQVDVQGIATDPSGNLIIPSSTAGLSGGIINVFHGPAVCGPLVGSITESIGQPDDAASVDAINGTIAVGIGFDNSGHGSVAVCTLSSGACPVNLTNPTIELVQGVAMAKNGDCWASARSVSDTAELVYFSGCSGPGEVASGFQNPSQGGLDIDNQGNIVSISIFNSSFHFPSVVYVYSGCNPACTLRGGPFTLEGESFFGHLGAQNNRFAVVDAQFAQVDIFQYAGHGTALTYLYSFNNGLSGSQFPEGAAYTPGSQGR